MSMRLTQLALMSSRGEKSVLLLVNRVPGNQLQLKRLWGLSGRKQNEIVTGSIKFSEAGKSIDILRLRDEEIRDIRGRKISMVFRSP